MSNTYRHIGLSWYWVSWSEGIFFKTLRSPTANRLNQRTTVSHMVWTGLWNFDFLTFRLFDFFPFSIFDFPISYHCHWFLSCLRWCVQSLVKGCFKGAKPWKQDRLTDRKTFSIFIGSVDYLKRLRYNPKGNGPFTDLMRGNWEN